MMVHTESHVNRFHEVLEHSTDAVNTTPWLSILVTQRMVVVVEKTVPDL
jgi:hypothetical protein